MSERKRERQKTTELDYVPKPKPNNPHRLRLEYAIQCIDRNSGRVGTFGHKGDMIAATPVFPCLVSLYNYAKNNNIELIS